MIFFFFFFQAEDGIRDVAVTGVQTCALPIYAKCTRKKGCRIGPSCADSEERCFSECFAGDADNPTSAQESSGVGRGNGIAYSNCCGPDHRAALHHGNYSPERIPRNPPGSSTAALGTAPGACGRSCRPTDHAPKGEVELHVAETDGPSRDSEECFLGLGGRCRCGS